MPNKAKQYDLAIPDFTAVIRLDPNAMSAYLNRGIARGSLGEYATSIGDFTTAIELSSVPAQGPLEQAKHLGTRASALTSRGYSYSQMGQYDKALADYDQAIELDPAMVVARVNRADAYMVMKMYGKAADEWSAVIALTPLNLRAYAMRAKAYNQLDRYAEALADIQQYQKLGGQVNQALLDTLRKLVDSSSEQ